MNDLTLMQKFADPQLIDTLSSGEKATGALITTIMGMGITFAVLILLWGILAMFARMFESKNNPIALAGEPAAVSTAPAPAAAQMPSAEEDEELVAVITAAICAGTGLSADGFVVRKISRVSGAMPAWGKAGQQECIDSRRM